MAIANRTKTIETGRYLYAFHGKGRALCATCAREVIDANPEMTSADWIVCSILGTHGDDSCAACDYVPAFGEVLS